MRARLNVYKVFSLVLGFFILIVLLYSYLEYFTYSGFPDGHLFEFDKIMKTVVKMMFPPGILMASYCFYIATLGSHQKRHSKLMAALFLFVLYVIIFVLIRNYLYDHTNHGQGG